MDFPAFWNNSLIKSGCAYQLGIIGEASSHLTPELRAENVGMPWRQIIGLRNILVHQYFPVDYPVIWDIIIHNLPLFEAEFRAILEDLRKTTLYGIRKPIQTRQNSLQKTKTRR